MSNPFNENRFFVDMKNDNQYAIMFEQGAPLMIMTVNGKTGEPVHPQEIMNKEIVLVDDETNELFRMEMSLGLAGIPEVKWEGIPDDLDPALNTKVDSLPPQHSRGADQARFHQEMAARRAGQMQQNQPRGGQLPEGMDLPSIMEGLRRGLFGQGEEGMPGQEKNDNWTPPKREEASKTTPSGSPKPGMKDRPSGGYKVSERELEGVLHKFGTDLTESAKRGELDPIIGRDEELDQLKQFLLRKNKSSVNLIGEAGVGKTAMFDALAQDVVNGDAEEELADARIISLDITGMNATDQAKYRGQFEKELKKVLDGLEERGGYINGQKIILCLDEIHSVLGAGSTSENSGGGAGQIMKPFLARGSVTCIGSTTLAEHKKHIESDGALNRRFQPLHIEPTDTDTTIAIMQRLNDHYGKYHGMEETASEEQLGKIVKLTDRFMTTQFQPDKSVGVLDDAMAIARKGKRKEILDSDIITAISKASNLSESFLNQKDHDRFVKLQEQLPADILGQDDQLDAISQRLVAARAGLTDPKQPWGAFVLAGPTGVGKTETARKLAEHIHGSEESLIKINMSNYMDKHAVSKLIGAPAGFVGHDDTEPEFEKVRKKPYSVVVFDEIEKAHPDVFNILLSVLDDGEVEDQKGNVISFRNSIIVMTTNLGAGQAGKHSIAHSSNQAEDREATYQAAVSKHFPPEFIGRLEGLGGIVVYNSLTEDVLGNIIQREVGKVEDRLLENTGGGLQMQNVEMKLTDEVRQELVAKANKTKLGARPVKGIVAKDLSQPLGGWLMKSKVEYNAIAEKGDLKGNETLRALFEKESKAEITINSLGKEMKPEVKVVELVEPKKEEKPVKVPVLAESVEEVKEVKEVKNASNDNKSEKDAPKRDMSGTLSVNKNKAARRPATRHRKRPGNNK